MTPAVSILMSVFNGDAYLAAAMDSLLGQTFTDFELIVVDDGSHDRTAGILTKYVKRDARVKVLSQANTGLTRALNIGVKLCTAPLLARMDPDDISLPTRLEKQVEYLEANPDVTLLGTRVVLIDPYGVEYQRPLHELTHDAIDAKLMQGEGWAVVQPSAVMRRDAYERAGGYDERYKTSQDFDLWLRMAETGRLANLETPLLHYRQHLASANFAKADQQKKLKLQILNEACQRRGLPPVRAEDLPPPPMTLPFESRRRWAWAAMRARRFDAARKHALTNLKTKPTSAEMWKLLGCSYRDSWFPRPVV